MAAGSIIIVLGASFLLGHPPIALTSYKVWAAVPGSVRDSAGRVGQIYRAPHGTLAIVVFNKGMGPRVGGPLDRFFTPPPEAHSVFLQCTVNPRTLLAGAYQSDEIFRNFLLSRIDGDGWASDGGGVATVKPEGHPNTYLLTGYERADTPKDYKVIFHLQD